MYCTKDERRSLNLGRELDWDNGSQRSYDGFLVVILMGGGLFGRVNNLTLGLFLK